MNAKCKICNAPVEKIFSTDKILNKYEADYLRCTDCGFIFIDNPFWLQEVYEHSAISEFDIGQLKRSEKFANILAKLIRKHFKLNSKFLDYGAGYGIFVRMMRDRGYDFLWYDKYSENIFAKNTIWYPKNDAIKFELISLIEVLEHIDNPLALFNETLKFADSLFITTEIIPNRNFIETDNWHYFAPLAGQHISFYSIKSLEKLAQSVNKYFYTDNKQVHLLTNQKINNKVLQRNKLKRFLITKIENYLTSKVETNSIDIEKQNLLNAYGNQKNTGL